MTREGALIIRTWRCELGCSWRRVAELAKLVWSKKYPRTDQQHGRKLCVEAAKVLGEDPDREPWN